jgi:hypothetical protein
MLVASMHHSYVDALETVTRARTENNPEMRDCMPFQLGEKLGE